jgi:c-di-GMP-related signal transduction protein
MFSFVDAYFDQPKEKLLNSLPFNSTINDALLHFSGEAGKMLSNVIALERGHWEQIHWQNLAAFGVEEELFEQCYLESLKWAADIVESLLG